MDPLTIMALVSAGVSAGQLGYNWWQGTSTADAMKRKADSQYAFANLQLNHQVDQANKDIQAGIGNDMAALASRGIFQGPMAAQTAMQSANQKAGELTFQTGVQRTGIQNSYQDALDQVDNMRAQTNLDALAGGAGLALDFLSQDYSRWANAKGKAGTGIWGKFQDGAAKTGVSAAGRSNFKLSYGQQEGLKRAGLAVPKFGEAGWSPTYYG